MAKFKHNKKRNTGFLYETLIRELTKAILKNNHDSKKKIVKLIKESFGYRTALHQDLKLYHSLTQTKNVNSLTAEKILFEVKQTKQSLDKKNLLSEQNKLTRQIRKMLGDGVLNNFVPNYKLLATISQIFNQRASIKTRVLLENEVLGQMIATKSEAEKQKMVPIDNLVFKTFSKKFNEKYSGDLLAEQKELLSKYASSFSDNGLELKMYLNEEVGRLKKNLKSSLLIQEFVEDEEMANKAKNVLSILESYKSVKPQKEMIQQIIKIQSLAHEINSHAID
jgi:hypothetical protein